MYQDMSIFGKNTSVVLEICVRTGSESVVNTYYVQVITL